MCNGLSVIFLPSENLWIYHEYPVGGGTSDNMWWAVRSLQASSPKETHRWCEMACYPGYEMKRIAGLLSTGGIPPTTPRRKWRSPRLSTCASTLGPSALLRVERPVCPGARRAAAMGPGSDAAPPTPLKLFLFFQSAFSRPHGISPRTT